MIAVLVWRHEAEEEPAGPPTVVSPAARQDLAVTLLDELIAAVRQRDSAAAGRLTGASPDDSATPELGAAIVENAESLQVREFTLRYIDEDLGLSSDLPEGQWAAAVDTTWQFGGFDREPARAEVTFSFEVHDDRARLVSVGGGARRTPLWLAEGLMVRRTPQALVLASRDADLPVASVATKAREAVAVVRRVVPMWPQRLVVEVPGSSESLDEALGADPGEYANIAAVTTTVDGSGAAPSPVHVFVNPTVFGHLEDRGAQVVMSHEVAHVATEAATAQAPLWLLEGFADYVALRDVDLPLRTTAGQVIAQVKQSGPPNALPDSAEFDTRTSHLGAAYEAAWIACRVLAEAAPEDHLVELYGRAAKGENVDATLRDIYGFNESELVRRWQDELQRIAQ